MNGLLEKDNSIAINAIRESIQELLAPYNSDKYYEEMAILVRELENIISDASRAGTPLPFSFDYSNSGDGSKPLYPEIPTLLNKI